MVVVGWALGKWHISRTAAGQAIPKGQGWSKTKEKCRQKMIGDIIVILRLSF
jgi:hypothetical protein